MNYKLTIEQLEQLARIYNTFATVSTRGDDTIIMGNCMQALKEVIEAVATQKEEETIEEKE